MFVVYISRTRRRKQRTRSFGERDDSRGAAERRVVVVVRIVFNKTIAVFAFLLCDNRALSMFRG